MSAREVSLHAISLEKRIIDSILKYFLRINIYL
jgi:hypothetical protein